MQTNKDTRYKQTYYRPDYILDRIDIWVDLEHFAVSLYELDPHVYISEASSNTSKPRYEFFSDKNGCKILHLISRKHVCITVGLEIT